MRILKYTLAALLLVTVCGTAFAASYVMSIDDWKDFEPRSVEAMERTLVLLDGDGREYLRLAGRERRDHVYIEDVPDMVRNAFLAIEDARFYEHGGVDLIRIGGAVLADIRSGSAAQGASTISQQLVKLSALTSDKTVRRKVTEIMMVFRLEREYSKDEILELYLNRVYFGAGAYGIETAARVYYSKSCRELTLSEAATMAAVIKAPSTYAPHINPERARQRRDLVLREMEEAGFITDAEREAAQREDIALSMSAVDEYAYGWFTDMALSEAEELLGISAYELLTGGYTVRTTLDRELQSTAQTLMAQDSYFPPDAADGTETSGALISIDAETGAVEAVCGGREHSARRSFNRATDMARQPGSAIKPVLVYAPALEYCGYTLADRVSDTPLTIGGWTPENPGGSYLGDITVREAIARSRNTPAVRVLQEVGVERAKEYASNVGIPFARGDESLSLALGGFAEGVSPAELAAAYMPFANGGFYTAPYCVTEIRDRYGNAIYRRRTGRSAVLSPETAFLITSALRSSVEYGTADRLLLEGIPIAAKTGTSVYGDDGANKDAWVAAYTTERVVVCWMGFDETDEDHCLEKGNTGGKYPAELVADMLAEIHKGEEPPAEFAVPEGIAAVRLDRRAFEGGGTVRAGLFEDDWVQEYFTAETAPDAVRERVMAAAEDFGVNIGSDGFPVVYLTPLSEKARYDIVRRNVSTGARETVTTLSGKGERLFFTDYAVMPGETYEYMAVSIASAYGVTVEGASTPPVTAAVPLPK